MDTDIFVKNRFSSVCICVNHLCVSVELLFHRLTQMFLLRWTLFFHRWTPFFSTDGHRYICWKSLFICVYLCKPSVCICGIVFFTDWHRC